MLRRIPFYLLIAAIFVYAVFPFYWALKSAFTVETDLFRTPAEYVPGDPDARELPRRSARATSS